MCGIVGYLGPKNALDVIMEGLGRLEYRGYDSSGVSIYSQHNKLQVIKSLGKLENLRSLLKNQSLFSHVGIGHIRWATHGGVEIKNAHPHGDENISIVHNGIIENYQELKEFLLQEGHVFKTDTDSEVFAILLNHYVQKGQSVQDAILTSFKLLRGNSAFLVIDGHADKLYAIKHGMSLVCGENENIAEVYVSSDPYALVGLATELYFPDDDVLCVLVPTLEKETKMQFFDSVGKPSHGYLKRRQEYVAGNDGKGDFEHYMLKEIYEQPGLLDKLYQIYFEDISGKKILEKILNLAPKRVHIVACGTAWHAGLMIKNLLENWAKIPADITLGSEFRYKDPLFFKGDVALFISQSGETADTLASQNYCKEKGLPTIAIVNVEGSGLYRNSDVNLLIHAGREVGVASTKAFTMQVLTGMCLSAKLAELTGQSFSASDMQKRFLALGKMVEEILHRANDLQEIAKQIYNKKGFIFTGRGNYFPIALEGALKLKEIAYVHAEGLASGELKHGPLALIDEEMVNVAVVGPELFEKTVSNIEEVKARRGIILAIAPHEAENLKKRCDYFFGIHYSAYGEINALASNVALQLMSYYLAKFKGTDIDRPRNLAKSVTVE